MRKLDVPFGTISDKLFAYLCSLYQPDGQFFYPLQKGQTASLMGTAFASYVAAMLGKENLLPGRYDIVNNILKLRDSDSGLFMDPYIKDEHFLNKKDHSPYYVSLQTTIFCIACLHSLGAVTDYRVYWLDSLISENNLEHWLDDLDWTNPWLVSNLDMFVGIFLLEWLKYEPDNKKIKTACNTYFRWHDLNQDKLTGFWGNQDNLFNAMAGAYHILIHYDKAGKKIPNIKNIIDSTISLVTRDGLFVYGGGGGSCEDMDAIDILIRCSLKTDYRSDEIKALLLNAALMIYSGQNKDGGFSWRIQPNFNDFFTISLNRNFLKGKLYDLLYKITHRSHYKSMHFYSNLSCYPYKINCSDLWSSWFRPLTLAFIAKWYPDNFEESCNWNFPFWPGLGFNPFKRIK